MHGGHRFDSFIPSIESMAPTVYGNEQFFYGEKGHTGTPVQIVRVTSASHNRKIISQLKKPVSIEKTIEKVLCS
jgi:hypothetical protein